MSKTETENDNINELITCFEIRCTYLAFVVQCMYRVQFDKFTIVFKAQL